MICPFFFKFKITYELTARSSWFPQGQKVGSSLSEQRVENEVANLGVWTLTSQKNHEKTNHLRLEHR